MHEGGAWHPARSASTTRPSRRRRTVYTLTTAHTVNDAFVNAYDAFITYDANAYDAWEVLKRLH